MATYRTRARLLLRVAAIWFVLALTPFLTLLSLPDDPAAASLPQDRVLWYNGAWAPQSHRRRSEDIFSTVRWAVELPSSSSLDSNINDTLPLLLLNDYRIPLVPGAEAVVELTKRDIWANTRPLLQACEIGGLVPDADSRMMYAFLLDTFSKAAKDVASIRVVMENSGDAWSLVRVDDVDRYPLLSFDLTRSVSSAAGWAATPSWRIRILLGAWLYGAVVPAYLIFAYSVGAVTVVWTLGAALFTLVFVLVKVALGVAFVGAGVFGFWMWVESRRSSGGNELAAGTPTTSESAGTAATSGAPQADTAVVFNVEPKDLEEGLVDVESSVGGKS
ncbi:hypothetical protein NEOLEDRAFT_1173411 [Neolentinus lepideus HHB14362 ss-1]|uniref:Uncharacterized protein n=1 Tax=Neolentinus lepideus HHB14362 ss-1 TaxID=1314782 RepID=A0A165MTW5_9AGAM|nr:hypothetical protein NEOLEDRAFT_1173411 [Neolentinus lepideus HHB14362 ss-1]